MTQDDIIRMAEKVGCGWSRNGTEPSIIGYDTLERFARLVAAEVNDLRYLQGFVDGKAVGMAEGAARAAQYQAEIKQ